MKIHFAYYNQFKNGIDIAFADNTLLFLSCVEAEKELHTTLTCYGTLSIANVCRVRNITHRHLSFLLKSDFPLAYHLGFAIDDNPLALLSNPMFHCLCQKCGGSPRGLSCYRKSLIIRTFNNSRF